MDPAVLIPVGLSASVVALVWVLQSHSSRNRKAFLQTVRTAIERGEPLSPEAIKALGAPMDSRLSDIKWGVIWIAVAAACVTFGFAMYSMEADDEILKIFGGIAAFPGFVGLALLGFGVVMRRVKD